MKKFLLTSIALLSATALFARHLSPEEAFARLSAPGMKCAPAVTAKNPRLLHAVEADGIERVYVFGNKAENGFIVVSADDAAPALLGYSDSETIDYDNLPDGLAYWLDEYARQIAYAASTEGDDATEPALKSRPSVAPKITTLWDQLEPFNRYTPMHNALPTPTGCVATAVAQIMNWHKWPAQPKGQISYQSYYVGTLSMDFDRVSFDWDKMLDRYYTSSPEENIDAVATLMQAVGYASQMVYHQKASGATGYNAANGLLTYFGYSKAMSLECREWYQIEEWSDLVYAELTENGPVYYEGTGNGGGHAFVCDGYDGDTGFFHFNWGWTGSGNGYYRLSLLNPAVQGTGGNSLGYNYSQDIIRGLKKAPEGVEENYTYIVGPAMGVVTPFDSAKLGAPITIKGYETTDGFKNYSVVTIPDVYFGARIHNVATGEDIDVCSTNEKADFNAYYKINIIRFNLPTALAEGDYTIHPLWRSGENGAWNTMRLSPLTRNYVPMTVTGDTATFGFGEAEGVVEVTLTEAPDFFTTNGDFTLKGTMSSVGQKDFSGLLCAVFVEYDSKGQLQIVDQGEVVRIDLEHGRTLDFEYTSKPAKGKLLDGDGYGVVIGNANTGELVSPIYKIKVGNRYGKLDMSTYNYSISGSNFLDPENVNVSANIKVVSGEYEGPLAIGFAQVREPFVPELLTVSDPFHLVAGDDRKVSFTGTISPVQEGMLYYAHLMYKNANDEWTPLSQYPITVIISKAYSGIENVSETSAPATYYDVLGRKVDNPAPGSIYIRVTADGKATKVAL